MARVFVLGAGASKAIKDSAPLNNELLPGIFEMYCTDSIDDWTGENARRRVGEFLTYVCNFYFQGISPCEADGRRLPPLEDVLTQLDYCVAEQRPLSEEYSVARLSQLRENLIYALYKVLKWKLGEHEPGLMEKFIRRFKSDDVIVCLNYDLIVDLAVEYVLRRKKKSSYKGVNYGIPARNVFSFYDLEKRKYAGDGYKLLKPHGSLNWLYCPLCQQIDIFEGDKAIGRIFREADKVKQCEKCHVRYDPIIITPTFLKSYKNSFMTQIWQATEAALREADEIVFIGYSLPDADMMLRTMFSRAWYVNRTQHGSGCQIMVVDMPSSDEQAKATQKRYERLFGDVGYFRDGFENYVNHALMRV